ncbi:MAG: putative toxin-antitoxin system toxin component, PIN family [Thermodesulfobacteriota bacterium]|nr:putative toxin-antitoxin system toxin component, PIN family [Thermodesulfobacteriota bacterium]
MKLIVDTNVLISGILKDKKPERVILFAAGNLVVDWIVSPEIMTEYKEVLGRDKFRLPADILKHWFDILDRSTSTIEPNLSIDFSRDQKDAKFLVCAIASNADYFITGDRDFNQAQKLLKTTIISVSMFIKLVIDPLSNS